MICCYQTSGVSLKEVTYLVAGELKKRESWKKAKERKGTTRGQKFWRESLFSQTVCCFNVQFVLMYSTFFLFFSFQTPVFFLFLVLSPPLPSLLHVLKTVVTISLSSFLLVFKWPFFLRISVLVGMKLRRVIVAKFFSSTLLKSNPPQLMNQRLHQSAPHSDDNGSFSSKPYQFSTWIRMLLRP